MEMQHILLKINIYLHTGSKKVYKYLLIVISGFFKKVFVLANPVDVDCLVCNVVQLVSTC